MLGGTVLLRRIRQDDGGAVRFVPDAEADPSKRAEGAQTPGRTRGGAVPDGPAGADGSETPSRPGPRAGGSPEPADPESGAAGEPEPESGGAEAFRRRGADGEPLTDGELRMLRELAARDREVRAHEAAHLAAAGGYARGGASMTYQTGPDGRRYAVGGEVSIDVSREADPAATVRKMQTVRNAALAPVNPSAQDRAVAAAASRAMMEARRQLSAEQRLTDAAYGPVRWRMSPPASEAPSAGEANPAPGALAPAATGAAAAGTSGPVSTAGSAAASAARDGAAPDTSAVGAAWDLSRRSAARRAYAA
jgi:hypothetical protein